MSVNGLKLSSSFFEKTNDFTTNKTASNDDSFDKVLNSENKYTDINDENQLVKENDTVKKDDVVKEEVNSKEDVSVKEDNAKEEIEVTDDAIEEDVVVKSSEVAQDNSISQEESVDISEEIMDVLQQISDILGISLEEIQNTLNESNLTLTDLSVDSNLISFIKEGFNINDNAQLLNMDNLKDMLIDVKDLLENNKDLLTQIQEMDVDVSDVLKSFLASESDDNVQSTININTTTDDILNEFTEEDGEAIDLAEIIENMDANSEGNEGSLKDSGSNQGTFNFVENSTFNSNLEINTQQAMFNNILDDVSNVATLKSEVVSNMNSNINQSEVVNQLLNTMRTELTVENTQEVKVVLKPAHLGEVSIKLAIDNGVITAEFVAESERIKEIIESNFNSLRDSLEEQGIDISGLEVSVKEESSNGNSFNDNNDSASSIFMNEDIMDEDNSINNQEETTLNGGTVSYQV